MLLLRGTERELWTECDRTKKFSRHKHGSHLTTESINFITYRSVTGSTC